MCRASESDGYLRVLTRFDATMIVIGGIIGAGVFFTPNDIGQIAQQRWTMIGVWLLGGLIALTGSLTYAELGGLFPRAGGVYVFLREAFGGLPAFLYGWAVILVIAPGVGERRSARIGVTSTRGPPDCSFCWPPLWPCWPSSSRTRRAGCSDRES